LQAQKSLFKLIRKKSTAEKPILLFVVYFRTASPLSVLQFCVEAQLHNRFMLICAQRDNCYAVSSETASLLLCTVISNSH